MARLNGFSPIITTSSLKHEAVLKSLGATHVLDRSFSSDAVLAEIVNITQDKPVAYAYDAISEKETQCLAYDALGEGGALAVGELPRPACSRRSLSLRAAQRS